MKAKFTTLIICVFSFCLVLTGCGYFDSAEGNGENISSSNSYTVSFNANGGTGTMANATVAKGASYTIPASSFSGASVTVPTNALPAIKFFKEWNTAADGSGTAYSVDDSITPAADITLYAQWSKPGFSVASDKRVYFSKGNLYWNGSAYRFEDNQYDITYTWTTSHVSHFYYSKDAVIARTGSYSDAGRADNDVLFAYNGGAVSGYTVLSVPEYDYLINGREDAADKWGGATVNGVTGLVILPDAGLKSGSPAFVSGNASGYTTNEYSASEWAQMEASGALFLPSTGFRNGGSDAAWTANGIYMSSTSNSKDKVHRLAYNSSAIYTTTSEADRSYGVAIRLVAEVTD